METHGERSGTVGRVLDFRSLGGWFEPCLNKTLYSLLITGSPQKSLNITEKLLTDEKYQHKQYRHDKTCVMT